MSRGLRRIGISVAGILLVLFFLYRGFPYERLAGPLSAEAGRALGARVEITELGPGWTWGGPGLEARGLRVAFANGVRLQLDRAIVRPAWSTAWLGGTPAFYAELEGPVGAASGVWRADGAWAGDLRGLDLAALPLDGLAPGLSPRGRLDAEVDLRWGEALEGDVVFEAREGSLQLPGMPIALPFESCRGALIFDAEQRLLIEAFALVGPMLTARGNGSVGPAASFGEAPLQIDLDVQATQPMAREMLVSAGVRLDEAGAGRLRLGGTPSAPQLR